jgi:hypothetical protein
MNKLARRLYTVSSVPANLNNEAKEIIEPLRARKTQPFKAAVPVPITARRCVIASTPSYWYSRLSFYLVEL